MYTEEKVSNPIITVADFRTMKRLQQHQIPPSSPPHVVIISQPLLGHVTPMLHLAELLSLANVNVTFLSSTHVHQRLTKTDLDHRFSRYPGFVFNSVSDGLPEDHPRNGQSGSFDTVHGFLSNAEPFIKEMINNCVITCLIVDGSLRLGPDTEAEVPVFVFAGHGGCYGWVFSCIPKLVEAGEMPFKDEHMDQLVQNVPGMNSYLRYRDLPSFCRLKDKYSCQIFKRSPVDANKKQNKRLILNTFEELEGPILSLMQSNHSKIYSIGPVHTHLKYRLDQEAAPLSNNHSSSLWEVDRSCLPWLDEKPDKSVVYASFGSITVLKREQLMEIWAGLVQSNRYFLWVIRPNLIYGNEQDCATPVEVLEGTEARGCIVRWCPQEEVLAHRAIGGFLTHSGWNSTMESIAAGVPMLCWPYFADQQVNSRLVSEVWRIGLDMKDVCDRNVVEKMIGDLMENKKDEIGRSMAEMSRLARMSVSEGGSSYYNLDSLIQDIKAMSLTDAP